MKKQKTSKNSRRPKDRDPWDAGCSAKPSFDDPAGIDPSDFPFPVENDRARIDVAEIIDRGVVVNQRAFGQDATPSHPRIGVDHRPGKDGAALPPGSRRARRRRSGERGSR